MYNGKIICSDFYDSRLSGHWRSPLPFRFFLKRRAKPSRLPFLKRFLLRKRLQHKPYPETRLLPRLKRKVKRPLRNRRRLLLCKPFRRRLLPLRRHLPHLLSAGKARSGGMRSFSIKTETMRRRFKSAKRKSRVIRRASNLMWFCAGRSFETGNMRKRSSVRRTD